MSELTLTYIGGPTAVLGYAGRHFVTDPTFDAPQRYETEGETTLVKTRGPGITRADIGTVDGILLSHHEHKDNLDWEGLELIATGIPTLSTPEAASDLFGGSVIGLDSWETYTLGPVTITAVPALHGPPGSEPLVGKVTGFVLEAAGEPTVYVSGDNASLPLVGQIAEHFAHIDVAVLFAGAVRVPGITGLLTLDAAQAVQAAHTLGASQVVGLHAEDWEHFTEDRATLEAAFAGTGVLVPTPRGQTVTL